MSKEINSLFLLFFLQNKLQGTLLLESDSNWILPNNFLGSAFVIGSIIVLLNLDRLLFGCLRFLRFLLEIMMTVLPYSLLLYQILPIYVYA